MALPEDQDGVLTDYYDWLFTDASDVPHIIQAATQCPPCESPIVEWGSGTGRVTEPLAKELGLTLALDADARMLHQLKRRIKNQGTATEILPAVADMTSDWPVQNARGIVIAFNTLRLLNSREGLRKFLSRCESVLPPGGLLIASLTSARSALAGTVTRRENIPGPKGPMNLTVQRENAGDGQGLLIHYRLEVGSSLLRATWHCLDFGLVGLIQLAASAGLDIVSVVDLDGFVTRQQPTDPDHYVVTFSKGKHQ